MILMRKGSVENNFVMMPDSERVYLVLARSIWVRRPFELYSIKESGKNETLKTFANLCIERQLITVIKTSNRQKNIPLNSSFSLNISAYNDNEDMSVLEVLESKTVEDPLETIIKREHFENIEDRIEKNLSQFEKNVLNKYIQGQSYSDIANSLDTQVKSVDNAIQRIRKKAIKCIDEGE